MPMHDGICMAVRIPQQAWPERTQGFATDGWKSPLLMGMPSISTQACRQWFCKELLFPRNPPVKLSSPLQHTVVDTLLDHHLLHQLVKLWQSAGYHAILPRKRLCQVTCHSSVSLRNRQSQCYVQHALCLASDAC